MVLRDIEDELVPYCLENNVGILAYSPLQRGLLTGKITKDYHFNEGDHRPKTPHFRTENVRKVNAFLNKIKPIAEDHGASLAQLVLNWTIGQPGISSVLAGARNPQQVAENAGSLSFNLSEGDLQTINAHLEELKLEL
jgi:aryl-alcohol dehydrogenase-like predicted oxidoreductase